MSDKIIEADPNSDIEKIIKEFLFHSLSEKQLSDLTNHFKIHTSNISHIDDPNTLFWSEIKIFGGIQPPFSDKDLKILKSQGTSLLFRNYRGNNYTKLVQVSCE